MGEPNDKKFVPVLPGDKLRAYTGYIGCWSYDREHQDARLASEEGAGVWEEGLRTSLF